MGRNRNPREPQPSTQGAPTKLALFTFAAGVLIGLGLMVWLATLPGELTSAQDDLSTIADWLVKTSGGALGGLILGHRLDS